MSNLIIYSLNVDSDKHGERVYKELKMEKWSFENRIERICEKMPENLDIIAINEVILNFTFFKIIFIIFKM